MHGSHSTMIREVGPSSCCSSSTWSRTIELCNGICGRLEAVLQSDTLLIWHGSMWRCLVRTYSAVLFSLTKQFERTSCDQSQETTCQKPIVSLEVLHHAMSEAERHFFDCICEFSDMDHSWLVDKALKLCVSTDVVDIHLHDFIWAYATVMEQGMWLGVLCELPHLLQVTSLLSKIWVAEDTKSDLFTAREQLLAKFKHGVEEETLLLVKFITDKLKHMIEEKIGVGAPRFLFVGPEGLKRDPNSIIGQGGYGVVSEAVWLRGRFAVKDIFYELDKEDDVLSGREQTIQARISHPNVINLVCCTHDPSYGRLSLVMEVMQQDLQLLMQKRKQQGVYPPFTLLEAVDLMLQTANGMEYLHSLNIMHRDLKSSNLLVNLVPVANRQLGHWIHLKIADFGMAKAKERSASFTTKPTGTLFWRAPEVFTKGSSAKYRKKADVYSFGLVCYEITTGELPFKESEQLYERVIAGERPQLPTNCPWALASLIEMCWNGNPKARPSFTVICRMLRYFKACFLLRKSHEIPSAAQRWLAHPISSDTCAHIADMLQAQDVLIGDLPRPLSILLEMYCCNRILQESGDYSGSSRREVISDYSTSSSPSAVSDMEQANAFSLGKSRENLKHFLIKWSQNFGWMWCGATHSRKDTFIELFPNIPKIAFKDLAKATDNFHERNKWNAGRFGPIYKGCLLDGTVVAIKMIVSRGNAEGRQEFHTELYALSNLKHRNVTRLLGYCVRSSEQILVYKHCPYGSLDIPLYDGNHAKSNTLCWANRIRIIKGVARGLRHLHEGSRVTVVHTDIRAKNILLDEMMNPKITYFGSARVFHNDVYSLHTGVLTRTVHPVATSREWTVEGDVDRFGILILEIVTGQKYDPLSSEHLVERAWSAYEDDEELRLVDPRVANAEVKMDELKRVVHVALQCTHMGLNKRPSMSLVCKMLSNRPMDMPLLSEPTRALPQRKLRIPQ